jgi:hypothetical protein
MEDVPMANNFKGSLADAPHLLFGGCGNEAAISLAIPVASPSCEYSQRFLKVGKASASSPVFAGFLLRFPFDGILAKFSEALT